MKRKILCVGILTQRDLLFGLCQLEASRSTEMKGGTPTCYCSASTAIEDTGGRLLQPERKV